MHDMSSTPTFQGVGYNILTGSFRSAEYNDINALLNINQQHYDCWNESEFESVFKYELPCIVYEVNQQIIGYLIYVIVFDEMKILNLTIDQAYHGMGYASKLICYAINSELANHINWVLLNVRVENIPAVSLYAKHGFKIISHRKNYYTNLPKLADSYLMELDLREAHSFIS